MDQHVDRYSVSHLRNFIIEEKESKSWKLFKIQLCETAYNIYLFEIINIQTISISSKVKIYKM